MRRRREGGREGSPPGLLGLTEGMDALMMRRRRTSISLMATLAMAKGELFSKCTRKAENDLEVRSHATPTSSSSGQQQQSSTTLLPPPRDSSSTPRASHASYLAGTSL